MEPAKMADDPYQALEAFLDEHDGIAGVSDLAEIAGIDDHVVRSYCRARGVRRIGATFAFGRAAAVAALDEILGVDARLPTVEPSYEIELSISGPAGDLHRGAFFPRDWPAQLLALRFSRPVVIHSVALADLWVALPEDDPRSGGVVDALPLHAVEVYVPARTRLLPDIGTQGVVTFFVPHACEMPLTLTTELRTRRRFETRES